MLSAVTIKNGVRPHSCCPSALVWRADSQPTKPSGLAR